MTITNVPDEQQPQSPFTMDEGETFQDVAAAMPETAQGFLDAALPQAVPGASSDADTTETLLSESGVSTVPKRTVKLSKKMRKSMEKLKAKTADLPIMWFHTKAKGHPEWELDDEEKELMTDAITTVFDVLDIEVEIEPLSWTLTSIWWVLSYPVVAFAFLFLSKKSLVMESEKGHQEQP